MLEVLAELLKEESGLVYVHIIPPTDRFLPMIKAAIDRIAIVTENQQLFGVSLFNSTVAVTPVLAIDKRVDAKWNDRENAAFFELGDPNCVRKVAEFMRTYGSSGS